MPRRLLRDGRIVADDWAYASENGDESGSAAQDVILAASQWLAEKSRWGAHAGRLGVILSPTHRVEQFEGDLARFDLIGADFPGPGEGRGYTQGRLLRERCRWRGELRAVGYVRRDQVYFLARCGFNSFELPDSEIDAAAAALTAFSAAYQPSNDLGLQVKPQRR